MITYHLRTPFTLVRRAVRLSSHATPHCATPCRAVSCHATRYHAARHAISRYGVTLRYPLPASYHAMLSRWPYYATTTASVALDATPSTRHYALRIPLFLHLSLPLSHPVLLSQVRGAPIGGLVCQCHMCWSRQPRVRVVVSSTSEERRRRKRDALVTMPPER